MKRENSSMAVAQIGPFPGLNMRRATAFLLGLAFLIPRAAFAGDLTAEQIFEKVSETYRNLRSFRYVEKWVSAEEVERGIGPGSAETTVVVSKPGKVSLSNKLYLLISNGEKTWTYLRAPKEYTEVPAAPLLEEEWLGDPVGGNYLSGYLDLARQERGAKLVGQKRLKVEGKQVECYVIDLAVSFFSGNTLKHFARRRLWVDEARFLVWRDEYRYLGIADPAAPPSGLVTSTLEEINTGPVAAGTFEFVPPKGAKRVDFFTGEGSGRPWSDIDAYDAPGASVDSYVIGIPALDFAVEDLEGNKVRLNELRGKIVVLEFWASWCKPCQKELADVQKLHDELASKDVVFLGVSDEDRETMKAFVKANGYTFPMLVDPHQVVHQLYEARWAPIVVVIDRKGSVAGRYIGARGESELRRHLEAAGLNAGAATKRP